MKGILSYALLTLATAAPKAHRPQDQWITPSPAPRSGYGKPSAQLESRLPKIPTHRRFEDLNPSVTEDGRELFESDIVLTAEQRDGRQAATNLWTSPVSFAISSNSSADRTAILAGIQHWRDHTCVEFNEVAEGSSVPHINVIKAAGCWSYIGKSTSSGGQDLSIGDGCTGLGTVVHEFGHALGLRHQQARHDRDNYVTILFENIQDGKEGNFGKRSTPNNYSVPYDLTSIMHYGSRYFSKNGKETIRVNNFLQQGLIGREGGLSHRDKQLVNAMYNCAGSCSSPPTCQNGGFVGKSCTCVCPPNTSGANCETLNGSYYPGVDCGNIDMTQSGTITTPNYPSNFPTNVVCWWVIKAPTGQRVKVTFTDMKMLYSVDNVCYWDYVALRYSGDAHSDDKVACDTELKGKSFTSTGNQFIVKFKSGNYGWYKGFSANVEFLA
ncbi:Blastula protease 10 [Amphibalanus amphitrite]|uniref:Metalloendopeptidase n=1 Tax=Amphibalanus amphitrite TaxID=1232801 RepID=A0A6A4WJD0_AMPAM|nr:blastula protease 10-like [Amphibalanus amphitrite]KAF0305329.1 Blastula protease 10 [Amphibalanus amphitrite]